MSPTRIIYLIHQSAELRKSWRELSAAQKRAVVEECAAAEECDVERIIEEVAGGQRRLF